MLSKIFVSLTNAKSVVIFASGPMFLSTLEWEISLSCHKAIFSKAGTTALLTILDKPVRFSLKIGFFLCGIAEDPFWFLEKYVAKKLGLKVEPISTQVIPRDRHAFYFSVLGIIAGSIERVAVEIRHLQRTEVYELQEFFSKKQKGSSAMPHKKNPILAENLTGLARIVRSYTFPALENIALWH